MGTRETRNGMDGCQAKHFICTALPLEFSVLHRFRLIVINNQIDEIVPIGDKKFVKLDFVVVAAAAFKPI
jgi:hypothetical protein